MPARREKGAKLDGIQLRNLIAAHGISFDGPIPPSGWPILCKKFFIQIRAIDHLWFDEYNGVGESNLQPVVALKNRVLQINRKAQTCRKNRVDEKTWRIRIEEDIVYRFDAEVICKSCKNRLWISEFQVLPDDPAEAGQLAERRDKRRLCQCGIASKAAEDYDDAGTVRIFSTHLEEPVTYGSCDDHETKGVPLLIPDRVFALELTESFKAYTSNRTDIRHSPFRHGKGLYPFLVIEAKSEKGSPGFESIETQTAFPIRSLLKLQDDLRSTSGISFQPLVWFMANQGDDWRVYAAIVEDSKIRVILLWQGSILSQDGALRILKIMDFIWDWARDVFRPTILRCLAKGDVNFRALSPSYSVLSSQSAREESDSRSSSLRSLEAVHNSMPPVIDLTVEDQQMLDIAPQPLDGISLKDWHPLLRFSRTRNPPFHWTRNATIRHVNLVLFKFQCVALPEEPETVGKMLRECLPTEGIKPAAKKFLDFLLKTEAGISVTTQGLSQLENIWTRTDRAIPSDTIDEPVYSVIQFVTYFSDWQVTRLLSCYTYTPRTLLALTTIACETNHSVKYLASQQVHQCPCLLRSVQALISLCDQDAASATLAGLYLKLRMEISDSAGAHFKWVLCPRNERLGGKSDCLNFAQTPKNSRVLCSENLLELFPGKPSAPFLKSLIENKRPLGGGHGAILVRKVPSCSESCPTFCLLVTKQIDFDNDQVFGNLISQLMASQEIYGIRINGKGRQLTPETENASLQLWVDIMMGKMPPDTPWPL